MLQSEPVTILIISEHAESIKLITVSLRGFIPGCRVDVAYSVEEARAWASSHEWTLILIDEQGNKLHNAAVPFPPDDAGAAYPIVGVDALLSDTFAQFAGPIDVVWTEVHDQGMASEYHVMKRGTLLCFP